MNHLKSIKAFWLNSYNSDRIAFGFELVSFVFTVGASLTLALHAKNPDMMIVYPGFLIGSLTQCYASFRRGSAWIMVLTGYFACVNVFGFGIASGWW